jgi:hypothetical protein
LPAACSRIAGGERHHEIVSKTIEDVWSKHRLECPQCSADLPQTVEFLGKSPYDCYADEFVRHVCREVAGWRREEWAYSPLFIWVKT